MKVITYGTRGSVPISNKDSVAFGGNTTCVRIKSDCIPNDLALIIDAGSGFVPMSTDVLREGGVKEMVVLFSHYHHDHTQGLFLSPLLFMKNIKLRLCGPVDSGIGPEEMMKDMMRPPYFPVHLKEVGSHLHYKNFDFPKTLVGLIHPKGGFQLMNVDDYERLVAFGKHLPIGKGKYPVEECLVVTMYKSRHPEQTISYRFEEKTTGKVFVFLTDHENEDGIPTALKKHLENVCLLIMDSQYPYDVYHKRTAGFGHGTADYCVKIAAEVGAKKLGLTHHDPNSTDKIVADILNEATSNVRVQGKSKISIFACADYQEIEV
jgi:phosphoribosyl 1,2-cyclic phosphodiesterase